MIEELMWSMEQRLSTWKATRGSKARLPGRTWNHRRCALKTFHDLRGYSQGQVVVSKACFHSCFSPPSNAVHLFQPNQKPPDRASWGMRLPCPASLCYRARRSTGHELVWAQTWERCPFSYSSSNLSIFLKCNLHSKSSCSVPMKISSNASKKEKQSTIIPLETEGDWNDPDPRSNHTENGSQGDSAAAAGDVAQSRKRGVEINRLLCPFCALISHQCILFTQLNCRQVGSWFGKCSLRSGALLIWRGAEAGGGRTRIYRPVRPPHENAYRNSKDWKDWLHTTQKCYQVQENLDGFVRMKRIVSFNQIIP